MSPFGCLNNTGFKIKAFQTIDLTIIVGLINCYTTDKDTFVIIFFFCCSIVKNSVRKSWENVIFLYSTCLQLALENSQLSY